MEQALDLRANLLEVGPEVLQHMSRDALALDEEAEEQVLGADVVMAHPAGLLEGNLDDLLDPRGWDDLLDDDPFVAAENGLDRLADLADLDAQVTENLGREALTLAQQSQQKMLRPDIAVVRPFGLLLRERQDLFRAFCESLERIQSLLSPCGWFACLVRSGCSTSI